MDKIIAAQSTAAGKGGIGIIRMTGKGCLDIAAKIFTSGGLKDVIKAKPNVMYFGRIDAGAAKDKGYLVYFKEPHSFTGEDTVEFHCHGGQAVLNAVLDGLFGLGAQPAERGEFTRRAFLNGKLALSDAEGVIDMINADSTAALKAAYRMMSGGLSKEIYSMQESLLKLIASYEAALDYPDEIGTETVAHTAALKKLADRAAALIAASNKSATVKRGVNVVLIGKPNTGKSSLLNGFVKKDRAIVTDIPGTTRDTLEESFEYDGVRLNVVDTAGIREKETAGIIELKGIERSIDAAKGADIVLYVIDSPLYAEDKDACLPYGAYAEKSGEKAIAVFNKSDIKDVLTQCRGRIKKEFGGTAAFSVSAKTGDGIDKLLGYIAGLFKGGNVSDAEIMTNQRHVAALRGAYDGILSAVSADGIGAECILVDLRNAWTKLGEITGQTATEDILDKIFSEFCLGK
ncbi:MAG: tRNA uridine-5-carboxymethylaminomethyl(34) synthesis GTPase MnmE [Clostridiales bacterium]|jgi:tRNA modification GTPase|nr:tRNA uridine-5-carboxymethylaminomethyl(34) synthesis GTPase MnmE [Clostridiales bacterium]